MELQSIQLHKPQRGEIITLNHRWQYIPEREMVEENVFAGEVIGANQTAFEFINKNHKTNE